MVANGVVQRKLALLSDQVLRLCTHLSAVPFDSFEADWVLRSMAERALQVAVEIMIDVAERIVALQGAGPVASAADTIEALVKLGVLEKAEPYMQMVRFRNLIVHQYESIDPAILFDLATTKLGDFQAFRNEIDRWMAAAS